MYTREQFGSELKEKVNNRQSVVDIGIWAYKVYFQYMEFIDLDLRDILLTLNTMELGPEFAYSYEELDQIADDLIAGRDVNL